MHRRLILLVIVAALVTLVGAASAAQLRGSDTATLKAAFATEYSSVPCVGVPTAHHCVPTTGAALVPGLGSVTAEYVYTVFAPPGEKCDSVGKSWPFTTTTNVLTVAGKGEIYLTLNNAAAVDSSGCSAPSGGPNTFPLLFTVTGGTGKFAGASGSGTLEKTWGSNLPKGEDAITGTFTVPGFTFDVAAPTIRGASPKIVVARKGVKRVRVVTKITAQDAVDGPVATRCYPKSGSLVPLGRTRVLCTATDSSANTARAQFTITVKRAA